MRELPGIVPSIGSAVNNGANGANFVDLRGLGSNRNLVLLDGNRIVPAGLGGQVDLNNIPLALVERVDALTGAAVTTYGAGHFVLLWGLGLEVTGWAARTAAPENLRSVESASISILIAGYAVALAAAGMATRTLVNRVFGLGLIGIVVAKLYLYDVWLLRLIYRVTAFAALGGLLLVMSFLYSRYRGSIESWLQRDDSENAGGDDHNSVIHHA